MRVERTFAFIDLCGFTAFTEAEGDERAVALLADFRACVREVSSDHGVRVAKWLGDGAMFVAVEQEPLVSAVLEVERHFDEIGAPLALRGGMACGPVILFEGDDYIGTAVNLAARLCDIAAPHEVLATPSISEVPDGVLTEATAAPVRIAGFARPVPVLRLRRRGHWAAVPRTA